MRMNVRLSGVEQIKRKLGALGGIERNRATVMALNKTAAKGRSEVDRQVRARFAIKAREVRSSVRVIRAGGGRFEAVVEIFGSPSRRGRSMNMIHFYRGVMSMAALKRAGVKAKRGAKRPLKFQIKRGAAPVAVKGAFVGNKGRTIFQRTGGKRLPIKPVQVIGVAQMFNTRSVRAQVMEKLRRDLAIEVDRAVAQMIRSGR